MILVSQGGPYDIPNIMPVMTDAFDPSFGEAWTSAQCLAALAVPGSQILIAWDSKEKISGFAISRWVLDEEELLMIGVRRDKRRQNVATALLDTLFAHALAAGRGRIFLEVRDGNPAQTFYEKAGFIAVGRRKQYYRGKEQARYDAITMSRAI